MSKVAAATLRARVAAILAVDYTAKLRDVKVPMLYLLATQIAWCRDPHWKTSAG